MNIQYGTRYTVTVISDEYCLLFILFFLVNEKEKIWSLWINILSEAFYIDITMVSYYIDGIILHVPKLGNCSSRIE